jgi:hypothetical protein
MADKPKPYLLAALALLMRTGSVPGAGRIKSLRRGARIPHLCPGNRICAVCRYLRITRHITGR